MRRLCVFFIFSVFLLFAYAQNVPQPQGWINDFAGVISAEYKDKLTSLIGELEQKTTTEIVVVTMKSIAPYDEKTYARMLFDNWKPGKKGKDNGVLVLLAIKERRWRIETGYGIEGILPDGLCGKIGRNYMIPYFREGKYGEGLYYGISAIAKIIAEDSKLSIDNLGDIGIELQQKEHIPLLLYLFLFFFFFLWNLPCPFIVGLPFTLIFALLFFNWSPILGILILLGYAASFIVRYRYRRKFPSNERKSFFDSQTYGGIYYSDGWGRGGFGGGSFGGFGGGGGGGGGAGGEF